MRTTGTNTMARVMNDAGLAAWFGGSLMGAVGLNGAAAQADDPRQRARVANAGWARWTPVNLLAIAVHLLGALQLTRANKARVLGQAGVGRASLGKAVVTVAALAATAYGRKLGQTIMDAGDTPVAGATEPTGETPPEVAAAQRKERVVQWAIPALTGALLVLNARMGEQQRPMSVVRGVVHRLNPAA